MQSFPDLFQLTLMQFALWAVQVNQFVFALEAAGVVKSLTVSKSLTLDSKVD